jgi:O-antigen/teichoic acid export membrane protein
MTNGSGESQDPKAAAPDSSQVGTGRKLLMGSISRAVFVASQVAVGFFMMPFLLEHLGNRWYGIWTILSSLLAYFFIMDAGLGYAVQLYTARHLAQKNYGRANAVINTALVIYSAISMVVLLVSAVLAGSVDHFVTTGSDVNLIALTLLILGVNVAFDFPVLAITGIIGAYHRFDLLSWSRITMLGLNTLLTVYFVGRGYGVMALAIIALICGQLSNVSYYLISKYCFRELRIDPRLFEKSMVRELAHYSLWSMLNSISSLIKFKMQPAVIAFFAGPVAVTHYVVGSRLADYFRDLVFQATNLTMPLLAKYHVLEQNDQIREKLRFLTKVNTLLAVFGGGMIIVLGKAFIVRWLGSEFATSYPILVILIVAMTVEVMIHPARTTMSAMAKVRFVGVLEAFEATLNVTLTIILMRYYGIVGAALGLAIPLLMLKLFWVPQVLCRHIQMKASLLYKSMLPAVFATSSYLLAYGWIVNHFFAPTTFTGIFTAGFLAVPLYLPIAFLMFERHEVEILLRTLPPGLLPSLRARFKSA